MCLRNQDLTCTRKAKVATFNFKSSLVQHQEVKNRHKGKRGDLRVLQKYKGVMRAARGIWDKA